jgi:hypothetical protein
MKIPTRPEILQEIMLQKNKDWTDHIGITDHSRIGITDHIGITDLDLQRRTRSKKGRQESNGGIGMGHHQVNDDLPIIKMIQILLTTLQRPSPDKIHQMMMNKHPLVERKETLLQLKTNGNGTRKILPAPHPVRRPKTEAAILLMDKMTRKSYADSLPPKVSICLIPLILILQVILRNQTKIAKNEGQRKREEADQSI